MEVITPILFDVSTYEEVKRDSEELFKRLDHKSKDTQFKDHDLVNYLSTRLTNLWYVEDGEMDFLEVSSDIKSLELGRIINEGAFGKVYESKWFGLAIATKIMDASWNDMFIKEIGILAITSHPNLIKYYYAAKSDANRNGESPTLNYSREKVYLVMELMQTSLSNILEAKRAMPYYFLIDVIYQIARGMYLKPDNVLLNILNDSKSNNGFHHPVVKLIDFGCSKINVGRNPKVKENTYIYGTLRYTAPEILKSTMKSIKMCAFEADVYSFGMTCSKILSGEDPFNGMYSKEELLKKFESGERPKLPLNCNDLSKLIEECWTLNPSKRPSFGDICKRLTTLKKKYLVGIDVAKTPHFGAIKKEDHERSKSKDVDVDDTLRHVCKDNIMGVERRLSNMKQLCKNGINILCFVGMGGIGKTTLAKIIFDTMQHMYNVSCFVESIQKNDNGLSIICKNLEEAQAMMKQVLMSKKFMLVLDDVKDKNQINDVVLSDVLHFNKGSILIVTTRNWEVVKSYPTKIHKFDIEELDKDASLKLFTAYSCRDGDELPKELIEIGKEIVRSCNGLPLSLKVLGSFLGGQKRLRCWERALQKLRRGRPLDGDEIDSEYKLWTILKISFDALKVEEKNMFLDICCFFCTIIQIWTNKQSGVEEQDGSIVLDMLVHQSMIKIEKDGVIKVHDQLQDMGRKIVEEEKEYKDTRIWNANMVPMHGITSKLEGIILDYNMKDISRRFIIKGLHFCSLRILICNIVTNGCTSLTSLPNEMANLSSLRSLHLNWCTSLLSLPNDLRKISSLKELYLVDCSSLKSLPNELKNLSSLERLDLSHCSSLTSLPNELENLSSLKILNLSHCSSLSSLSIELRNLSSLAVLCLWGCSSLTSLPNELINLSFLTSLNLSDLSHCSSLICLPNDMANLSSLKKLNLSGCLSLICLPNDMANLSSLIKLDLSGCLSLNSLPNILKNLSSLTKLSLNSCSSYDLAILSSLTTLSLICCSSLISLPNELANLSSLIRLDLSGCLSLTSLPNELTNLSSLKRLDLSGCSSLTSLPNELKNLSSLRRLTLSCCSSLISL
uniref:Protein kinase domain-containing protein n=1 Tax=Physcomitrium patens TaxID=3218 RepID=A0A2K1L1A1_PHYPA|nr:hypothetical protein PHYPA_002600 [Physcomitrium patens]